MHEDDCAGESESFQRDDAWLGELHRQLTEALRTRLHDFARRRAIAVAHASGHVDDYYVRELVQDAIADTYLGVLRWHPNSVDLETHLVRAIQWRTRDDRERAADYPHVRLHDGSDDPPGAHEQAAAAPIVETCPTVRHYASELVARLRSAAAGDRATLRLLDAYEAGAITKADVLACTGMSAPTYHKARIRLGRLVRNMPYRRRLRA